MSEPPRPALTAEAWEKVLDVRPPRMWRVVERTKGVPAWHPVGSLSAQKTEAEARALAAETAWRIPDIDFDVEPFQVAHPDENWENGRGESMEPLEAAARALQHAGPDGGPLFTREDVELIRYALARWDGMVEVEPGVLDYVGDRLPDSIHETVADRLESLLPPEEP